MNFLEEAGQAARGLLAILIGRRNAPQYFDLGPRGLAGSFLAYLIALSINAFVPPLMGWSTQPAAISVAVSLLLFATQTGLGALALQQFGRLDGLMPYLVADNWSTFYVTLLSLGLAMAGLGSDFSLVVLGIFIIVIEINIARLIVTLAPLQIAAFLVAQIVGVVIGLAVAGMFVPIPVGATG